MRLVGILYRQFHVPRKFRVGYTYFEVNLRLYYITFRNDFIEYWAVEYSSQFQTFKDYRYSSNLFEYSLTQEGRSVGRSVHFRFAQMMVLYLDCCHHLNSSQASNVC